MPTKTSVPKKSSKTNDSEKKPAAKAKKPPCNSSEERFIRDLLIRGEAVEISPDEDLPPDATHKIVNKEDDDLPQVERERFSLY